MASAPPLEASAPLASPATAPPPSYDEAMTTGPQGPQPNMMPPPPAYNKGPQPLYPAQAYSPMAPPPQPGMGVASPVVSVQTVYIQPGVLFKDSPVQVFCPKCSQSVITSLEYTSGTMAWLACAGLFVFGCIYGCCLIPFCVDSMKDVTHLCPNCLSVLGVFRRL